MNLLDRLHRTNRTWPILACTLNLVACGFEVEGSSYGNPHGCLGCVPPPCGISRFSLGAKRLRTSGNLPMEDPLLLNCFCNAKLNAHSIQFFFFYLKEGTFESRCFFFMVSKIIESQFNLQHALNF